MFFKIQIMVVLALIVAIIFYFGKKQHKEKRLVAGLIVCVFISAVISNAVLNLIPLPTDEVVVTALGDKNDAASSNEVYIVNYLVGGKNYEVNNPTEGKWFWKGNVYMWRNENDSRQPDGTTRSITLQIPYGRDRSIQFGLSQWNGFVEVTYGGESQQYDLYKGSDKTSLYAPVPDTEAFALYGAKLLRMVLFVLMIAALTAYPAFCAIHYEYGKIQSFWKKHWDKIFYIGLAILYILLMQKNSVDGSLWGDEIWELGWKYTNSPFTTEIIYYQLTKLWFLIMPYGQEHLLLLPQIAVAGTIYLAGVIGNKINGKRLGILFASLVAFSLSIVYQCAMEYRVYAFMLFSTALLLYTFINKCKYLGKERYLDIFIHSLAITITMDMHPFAIAVAGLVMIADFVLIILRKSSKKVFLEFIIPCIYGIWWILSFLLDFGLGAMNNGSSWVSPTNIQKVISTLTWLMGSSDFMFAVLIFSVIVISGILIQDVANRKFSFQTGYIKLFLILIPIVLITFIYIYSTKIKPDNRLFIDRYFISIIIFLLCIVAITIDEIIALIANKSLRFYSVLFLILIMCISTWSQVGPWEIHPAADRTQIRNYKGIADYLLSQNEIYSNDTYFVLDYTDSVTIGFQYYLTHKGTRDLIQYGRFLPENLDEYKTIYYAYLNGGFSRNIYDDDTLTSAGFVLESDNSSLKIYKFVKKG